METIVFAALVIGVCMAVWFLAALIAKRNDVADIARGLGFVVVSTVSLAKTHNHSFTTFEAIGHFLLPFKER